VTTELNLAPRLLQLQSYDDKTMGKLLEEIWGSQKKVWRMHFQRVNFVLVCPPVEKKMLHSEVFNTSASPL
jgi:hypothetical protein